jgi:hypothetical protein
MSRKERIAGLVLGIVLFAGLFYLIYDSFMAESAEATYLSDTLDEAGDLDYDEGAGEPADAPAVDAGPTAP